MSSPPIGFVSTAGFTLLQGGSDESEMGRVNAAHQFIRTLCITYGVAIGGAVLLFVVDRRAGDVEMGPGRFVLDEALQELRRGLPGVKLEIARLMSGSALFFL